jgi:tetratricopeptide (TPR) repeat protein
MEQIARVDLEGGDLPGAHAQLEQALARAPQSAAAHNNLGVVLAAMDSLAQALGQWRTALALGRDLPGIALNPPLARWAAGDSAAAAPALRAALGGAGGYGPACRLIGLAEADSLERQSGYDAAESSLRERVRNLLRHNATAGPASGGTSAGKPPGKAGQLLAPNRGIWKYLYWAE